MAAFVGLVELVIVHVGNYICNLCCDKKNILELMCLCVTFVESYLSENSVSEMISTYMEYRSEENGETFAAGIACREKRTRKGSYSFFSRYYI